MVLTQDILLPILLLTIVANVAIVAVLVATGRLSRKRMFATGHSADPFEGAVLSTSYVDRSDGAWPASTESTSGWDAAESGVEAVDEPELEPADEPELEPAVEAAVEPAVEPVDELVAEAAVEQAFDWDTAEAPAEVLAAEAPAEAAAADDAVSAEPAVTEPDLDPIAATSDAEGESSGLPAGTGVDPLTGLPDAAAFHRLVAMEDARVARYHHPTTVVIVELEGLDRLVERLGPDAGDRIIPAVADTLRRLARGADTVARLGPGQFGVLLPETDEILAINYVERVRRACELWLESGAIALQLAIGWAGTGGDPTLRDVQRIAVERMHVEARRAARRAGADDGPGGIS